MQFGDWSSDVCSSDLHFVYQLCSSAGVGITPESTTAKLINEMVSRKSILGQSESRSEERRVGKECRSRWSPYREKKKKKKRLRSALA